MMRNVHLQEHLISMAWPGMREQQKQAAAKIMLVSHLHMRRAHPLLNKVQIPEAVVAIAGALGVSMGGSLMLVQVPCQFGAEGQGSNGCGEVYDALVGSKVARSKQL